MPLIDRHAICLRRGSNCQAYSPSHRTLADGAVAVGSTSSPCVPVVIVCRSFRHGPCGDRAAGGRRGELRREFVVSRRRVISHLHPSGRHRKRSQSPCSDGRHKRSSLAPPRWQRLGRASVRRSPLRLPPRATTQLRSSRLPSIYQPPRVYSELQTFGQRRRAGWRQRSEIRRAQVQGSGDLQDIQRPMPAANVWCDDRRSAMFCTSDQSTDATSRTPAARSVCKVFKQRRPNCQLNPCAV